VKLSVRTRPSRVLPQMTRSVRTPAGGVTASGGTPRGGRVLPLKRSVRTPAGAVTAFGGTPRGGRVLPQ
jgi:hypothetical protein